MNFNPNIKTTQSYLDDYNMLLGQNYDWNPDGDHGMGDCISDNFYGYLAWEYAPFIDGVKSCYIMKEDKKGKYLEAYRHPTLTGISYNDMSRDHITYTLLLMKYTKNDEFLKMMSKYLRWKISDRYSFTLDSWLWMKGICGNRLAMTAYYTMTIPLMFLNVLWNKLIYWIGGFGKELPQIAFTPKSPDEISKTQLFLRKIVYPTYALAQNSMMMYVSPNSFGKWLMKKVVLMEIDHENFFLRAVCDAKVNKSDVDGYQSMTSWRWTTKLNNINDRDCQIIRDQSRLECNVLDVDVLKKVYEQSVE